MCGSTCFERFHAHHQGHTTALAASGFTVGAWWPDHDQQRCYHQAPTVKSEAANAVVCP